MPRFFRIKAEIVPRPADADAGQVGGSFEVCDALEPAHSLLEQPSDHTGVVVAVADDVVQSREAMRLAGLLHLLQLFPFKAGLLRRSPIVIGCVHRKTGGEGAIGTYDQRILAGP